MNSFRLTPLLLAFTAAVALPVQAQNVVDMYESARVYDATYQSAKSQFAATLARAEQARAGTLPTVGLSLGASFSNLENTLAKPPKPDFGSQTATISASQPLYRPANWATYEQGKKQVDQAQLQLLAADQDLIVRVSQTYFDVLASQDSVAFVLAQKAAVAEQLAFAKRNFEVGTSTITDTREAQARFDLVVAQEIAARNDLRVKKIALDQLVGKTDTQPKSVSQPVALPAVLPEDVNAWVQQSEDNHPGIKLSQVALDVALLETTKAQAGNKPTIDLTGSYNITQNNGTSSVGPDTTWNRPGTPASEAMPASIASDDRSSAVAVETAARML